MAKRLISILSASMRCILASGRGEDPYWMVRQDRRHDMGSLRQVLDRDQLLAGWAGIQLRRAHRHRSHKFLDYCGTVHASKSK